MQQIVPSEAEVVVLGGGIHGVGVFHDLLSRNHKSIVLLEKNKIGSGTSSRSTKLIHGGLRYLQRPSQIHMVYESLSERHALLQLAPDIVKPLELILPCYKGVGEWPWMVRIGLSLYDNLTLRKGIKAHKVLSPAQAIEKVPILNPIPISHFFSFWDGQSDDLALVLRIAAMSAKLGGGIFEKTLATHIQKDEMGFIVHYKDKFANLGKIRCRFIVNCLGPWANQILEHSNLSPTHQGINNKGSHLVMPDMGLKAGLFMQNSDGRAIFILPWQGKTLLGTTEEIFSGSQDKVFCDEKEIDYLFTACNPYLKYPLSKKDILFTFSGLRWLAVESDKSISKNTREAVVGKIPYKDGFILTIYGGKLTSYRKMAKKIGDLIYKHRGGDFVPSATLDAKIWEEARLIGQNVPEISARFI